MISSFDPLLQKKKKGKSSRWQTFSIRIERLKRKRLRARTITRNERWGGRRTKGKAVAINDIQCIDSPARMHHLSLDLSSLFLKAPPSPPPRQHFCRPMYLFNRDTLQCDAFSPICSKQSICRTYCDRGLIVPCKQCVFLYAQTRQKVEDTTTRRDLHRSSQPKSGPRYFRFVFPPRIHASRIVDDPSLSLSLVFPLTHAPGERVYKGPSKSKHN